MASLPESQQTGLSLESSWNDLQEIQYLPAIEAVANYSSILSTTYQDFKDMLVEELTEEEWLWANSIVHARTFRYEGIVMKVSI